MNPETFAEWMRRQGHRVFRTSSSYWYEAGPRVLQAFPYHWVISPSEEEIRGLMFQHGIVSLRYSTPLDSPRGMISYHIVLQPPYELDALKSQTRNGVKRGLAHFNVERIPFERLATEGWELQRDTLERQERLRSMTRECWERLCRSAERLSGFEAWAAISGGELAGAVIICRIGDTFEVPYAMSRSCFLGNHVNNVLFYSISREMLGREGIREIFFTVQPLDAPTTVDDFKLRMGFMPRAVRQRVDFHPWLSPFATPSAHAWTRRLLRHDPSHPILAKAEGMLRFHVQGKHPVSEQEWPDCLAVQKDALLESPLGVQTPVAGRINQGSEIALADFEECQLPDISKFSLGNVEPVQKQFSRRIARAMTVSWGLYVKKWLKRLYHALSERGGTTEAQVMAREFAQAVPLKTRDWVRVRSRDEIASTLSPFKELKGCEFLESMHQYCGTQQRVFKTIQRFLDGRESKVKKASDVILLENVICRGTPAFGKCDRSCFLLWREEWLEKIA